MIRRLKQDPTKKVLLVMVLPCVAGAVNGSGLFEVGAFTSHMSGNTARLGHELAQRHFSAAATLAWMLFAFLVGATLGAALVERSKARARAHYAPGLFLEALVLTAVAAFARLVRPGAPAWGPELIVPLCFAMGLQNAMITRLSGAVVRTTHVTGIITDIGIELVRVWQWLGERPHPGPLRLRALVHGWADPTVDTLRLHATLWLSFVGGNLLGALLFLKVGGVALLAPVMVVVGLAVFDARTGLDLPGQGAPHPG